MRCTLGLATALNAWNRAGQCATGAILAWLILGLLRSKDLTVHQVKVWQIEETERDLVM
jgi:ribulose kinase